MVNPKISFMMDYVTAVVVTCVMENDEFNIILPETTRKITIEEINEIYERNIFSKNNIIQNEITIQVENSVLEKSDIIKFSNIPFGTTMATAKNIFAVIKR